MVRLVGTMVDGVFMRGSNVIARIENWRVYIDGEFVGEVETRQEAIKLVEERT